jgi:ABC-type dipeptide/oligopeptide/nickel transport system ATPase subunit
LERPGAGEIRVSGRMGDVQLVMQDSLTAFEPRMKVKQILEEPFEVRGMTGDVRVILDKVGLAEDCLERRAAELSGGQRYRLLLGRALAARPKAMILDETFSALDDRARDQMTELVLGINLTLVLVSHDLTWLGRTCGRLAVMDGGRIVEDGETAKVLSEPAHPWTRRLVEAMRAVA